MPDHAQAKTQPAPFKHYLWLFNRQKRFLREKVIESLVPLTPQDLDARYNELHEDLVDEVWPAKIGWIDWSNKPWAAPAA